MATPDASQVLNGAASQFDRILAAPAPHTAPVDGRSLAQVIAFGAQIGALIRFYDIADTLDGDWAEFFTSDPAVAEALHAALDLPEIERALQRLLAAARPPRDRDGRLSSVRRAMAVIARLLAILERGPLGPRDPLTHLKQARSLRRADPLGEALRALVDLVADLSPEDGFRSGHRSEEHAARWLEALIERVEGVAAALLEALRQGVAAAEAALLQSLGAQDHAAQAALYNAFALLFVEVRSPLNLFAERLVDFYYRDILRQHALPPQPSRVFLTFTAKPNAGEVSVARGAVFLAGTDAEGRAINFAADNSLEVTPATVTGLSVHRVETAPIAPGSPLLTPSRVLTGVVDLGAIGQDGWQGFPLFGSGATGASDALTMVPATLGFTIASPALLLRGGQRTITITLTLAAGDLAGGGLAPPPADALSAEAPLAIDTAASLVQSAFSLAYTTAGGWMTVKGPNVTASPPAGPGDPAALVVSFILPPDAPPLTPLSETPAPTAPTPDTPAGAYPDPGPLPAIIASLIDDSGGSQGGAGPAGINVFTLLSSIHLSGVEVAAQVDGLAELTITTPNGPADTSQNFALLGLGPSQNAAFGVYADELFIKPIDHLSVTIAWAALPANSTSFLGYYQGYTVNQDGVATAPGAPPLFTNSSFLASFNLVSPGLWSIDPKATTTQTQPLFAASTAAPDQVAATSTLTAPNVTPADAAPAYYNPSASLLQVVLAAPVYGFGAGLYSSNLMAASVAQSAAMAKGAGEANGAAGKSSLAALLANLGLVNLTAPDNSHAKAVSAAVSQTVSGLTGQALASLREAASQGAATAAMKAPRPPSLETTTGKAAKPTPGGIWARFAPGAAKTAGLASGVASLEAWIAANAGALAASAAPLVETAGGLLATARNLLTSHASVVGKSPPVARPTLDAAVKQAQAALAGTAGGGGSGQRGATTPPPPLPNPPWQPTASSVTVTYHTSVAGALTAWPTAAADGPSDLPAAPTPARTPTLSARSASVAFSQVRPFATLASPPTGAAATPLIPSVAAQAALYISLSAEVSEVTLLFILAAGPEGWFDETPTLVWQKHVSDQWIDITVLTDGARGLSCSGAVSLSLATSADARASARLRVLAVQGATKAPLVKNVIANALTASWVGPGGAGDLAKPLPAGSITKSQATLNGVAAISQPMDSVGGRPPAVGRAFHIWMAERLRHKGFGIDAWDYARLVLEAEPTVWQAAVIPATDGATGLPAPGRVWVVVVAGPLTPNVTDTTVPQADPATLDEIGARLTRVISPFVATGGRLAVTNPPYVRLTVRAKVEFIPTDTTAAWIVRLQADLIAWLSPWPDPTLGPRRTNYYTRHGVAEFVRNRPYVVAVLSLDLTPESDAGKQGWRYVTSSLAHDLTAWSPPASTDGPDRQPVAATAPRGPRR
jgi:hypothetical protein